MKSKRMKKAYLLAMFILCNGLVLPTAVNAQIKGIGLETSEDSGEEEGALSGLHVLWLDHGGRGLGGQLSNCSNPMVDKATATITISAVNLNEASAYDCIVPAVIQIRDKATGRAIGLSEEIHFNDKTPWKIDTQAIAYPCHGSAVYYTRQVKLHIDLAPIACQQNGKGNTQTIDIEFEFMARTAAGSYVSYFDYGVSLLDNLGELYQTGNCMYHVFDPVCLGHGHDQQNHHNHNHGGKSSDHNHYYDHLFETPIIPHKMDGSAFVAEGSLCYACTLNEEDYQTLESQVSMPVEREVALSTHSHSHSHSHSENELPKAIQVSSTLGLKSFPSPFKNQLFLNYFSMHAAEVQIEIKDISGADVWSTQRMMDAGQNTIRIGLENQVPGIYLIRLFDGTQWISQKVLKSN